MEKSSLNLSEPKMYSGRDLHFEKIGGEYFQLGILHTGNI